jgi:hypothetical protein
MHKLFILLEWFNENHTGEELIGYIFIVFASVAVGATQIWTLNHGGFILGLGVILCFNFYAVTLLQRWYVNKTQEKLEDFDYSNIIDEEAEEVTKD